MMHKSPYYTETGSPYKPNESEKELFRIIFDYNIAEFKKMIHERVVQKLKPVVLLRL